MAETTTKEDIRIDADEADELNREAADDLERIERAVKQEAEEYVEAVDGDGNEKESADREHQVAQQTGSTDAAMRAQQHENRKDQKSEGFMESVKESLGKAGEAIKEAAVDAKDNVKQGAENMKERM